MREGIRVSICVSLQKSEPVDHELAKPGCALFVQTSVLAVALYTRNLGQHQALQ